MSCKNTRVLIKRLFSWFSQGNCLLKGLPRWWSAKESACPCRRCKRHRFDPWVRRFSGVEKSNTLQCSWLESSMDRGAWQGILHVVTKSRTWLSMRARARAHVRARTHTHTYTHTHTQELTEHQILHNASLRTVNQHSPTGSSFSCSWANFLASLMLPIRELKGIFNFLSNSTFLLFLILKWPTFNSDRNPILKYEDYENTV